MNDRAHRKYDLTLESVKLNVTHDEGVEICRNRYV